MEKTVRDSMNNSIIKKALKYYDFEPEELKDFKGFENFVYGYKDVVIRFVHSEHRTYDLVLAEIEFIDYLALNGASVTSVIKSKDGNISERIDCDNGHYFTVTLFTKAPGTFIKKEEMTPALFYSLGKDTGKIHHLTKQFKPTKRRYDWDQENYIEIYKKYLDKKDEIIITKAKNIQKKIKSIPKTNENYGLIHTDLHFGNIYLSDNNLTFFDFDDSSYKYLISDIAITFYYYFTFSNREADRTTKTIELLKPYLQGYLQYNQLDTDIFMHLNDFMKMRETILYLVIKGNEKGVKDKNKEHPFLAYLYNNIANDIPFFEDLDSILEETVYKKSEL